MRKKRKWSDTSYFKILQKRMNLGWPMMVATIQQARSMAKLIQSQPASTPELKAKKALAITRTVINGNIAAKKSLYWWRI